MKKIKTMDLVLVLIAILTIPSTLVTCWFSAVVGEFGVLGWIKTTKLKQQEMDREKEIYERLKADRNKTGGVQ